MSPTAAAETAELPKTPNFVLHAHERAKVRDIPVTPAFDHKRKKLQSLLKYQTEADDYFTPRQALRPNVISATFTIPHILRKTVKSEWQTDHCFQRSAHLDCLRYLSVGQATLGHTIIAWTGEISQSEHKLQRVSNAPSSTSIAPDGHPKENDDPAVNKVIFISFEEQKSLEAELFQRDEAIIPVWLSEGSDHKDNGIELRNQSKWRGYAEHDLYPLLHYKMREPTGGGVERLRWNDYYKANTAFADKICETYKDGDVLVVHDYYLMLVPELVRQKLPDARIAFILQTPFPTSELFRCLQRRKELLKGVLGADIVVFQARIYAEHFANSCGRILQLAATGEQICQEGRHVQLADIPSGINIQHVLERAFSPEVDRKCEELLKTFVGKNIILGHDPMTSLSGLDKKLQAYERFLHNQPEWRAKVVLVQMVSPAMLGLRCREESEFSMRINLLVSSINSEYGSICHTPVQLALLSPDQDEHFALLRYSDIALITSAREGIRTTALDYAICQGERQGTLILSEFSGTAAALDKTVVINPWDTSKVADEIHAALTVSMEQRTSHHAALFQQVQELRVERWAGKLFPMLEIQRADGCEHGQ